jgi:hypothetical protein
MPLRAPAATVIYLVFCAVVIFAPPRWNSHSGLASLIDKHRRLQTIDSPKLVLVGGSNVATGLDSAAVESALHHPVVNMGLGASLGLRYMLEEVKSELRPGDFVVISPEYDFFCNTSKTESNAQLNGSTDLINLVQAFPGAARWIIPVYAGSPSRLFGGLDDICRFMALKIAFYKTAFEQISQKKITSSISALFEPKNTIFTHRENYNSFGDFTGHLNLPSPTTLSGGILRYQQFHFNKEATDTLSDFGAMASSKHVTVILIPPPLPKMLYDERKSIVEYIFSRWQGISTIAVLATPERYTFRADQMFDTPYHLNASGRKVRTERLIADLATYSERSRLAQKASSQ